MNKSRVYIGSANISKEAICRVRSPDKADSGQYQKLHGKWDIPRFQMGLAKANHRYIDRGVQQIQVVLHKEKAQRLYH